MSCFTHKVPFLIGVLDSFGSVHLLEAYKKKGVFQPKVRSPLLFIREFSKHNHTQLFCESVLGLSHMAYAEGFAHFGQKE